MNTPLRTGWLSLGLNLVGVALVAYALYASFAPAIAPALTAIGTVGLLAWLVAIGASTVLARRAGVPAAASTTVPRVIVLSLAVAALCGAFIAGPTLGLGIALTVAALLRTIGTVQWPLWWGLLLGVVSAALVAVGAIVTSANGALSADLSPGGLLAIEGGIVISALGGVSRRQFRFAEQQAEALRDERMLAVEKQAALTALSQRQGIAREIHDVLAHSLGGLVIQLDAVDALLEAGQTGAAEARIRDARQLAASGLAEARRAVDALREPDAASTVAAQALWQSLDELVAADRALGSPVTLTVVASASAAAADTEADTDTDADAVAGEVMVSAEAAHALRRVLQEALTNARKHAAGSPVDARLEFGTDSARLVISNPLGAAHDGLHGSGGTNGIAGMRERIAALPGAAFSAGVEHGRFVVQATVPTTVPTTAPATLPSTAPTAAPTTGATAMLSS